MKLIPLQGVSFHNVSQPVHHSDLVQIIGKNPFSVYCQDPVCPVIVEHRASPALSLVVIIINVGGCGFIVAKHSKKSIRQSRLAAALFHFGNGREHLGLRHLHCKPFCLFQSSLAIVKPQFHLIGPAGSQPRYQVFMNVSQSFPAASTSSFHRRGSFSGNGVLCIISFCRPGVKINGCAEGSVRIFYQKRLFYRVGTFLHPA